MDSYWGALLRVRGGAASWPGWRDALALTRAPRPQWLACCASRRKGGVSQPTVKRG